MNNKVPKKKAAKSKPAKKRTVKRKDTGLAELLGLLKAHPHLVHTLVVDRKRVRSLLKSKAARRLIPGANARKAVHRRLTRAPRVGQHSFLHTGCGRITTP